MWEGLAEKLYTVQVPRPALVSLIVCCEAFELGKPYVTAHDK